VRTSPVAKTPRPSWPAIVIARRRMPRRTSSDGPIETVPNGNSNVARRAPDTPITFIGTAEMRWRLAVSSVTSLESEDSICASVFGTFTPLSFFAKSSFR